jgi:hypothetical protein
MSRAGHHPRAHGRQAARADLPATASPLPVVGLVGLLALLGGIGIGFARRATTR